MGERGLLLDSSGAGPIERSVVASSYQDNNYVYMATIGSSPTKPVTPLTRTPALQGSFDLCDTTPLTELWGAVKANQIWNSDSDGSEPGENRFLISSNDDENCSSAASRAFITFKSFAAATTAKQVLHCGKPGRMTATAAPEPRDVCWFNIFASKRMKLLRWILVEIALVLLMVFFPLIVTLGSYVFSIGQMTANSALMNDLCNRSEVFRSAAEMVQPVFLLGIMSTLPTILGEMGIFEGIVSKSKIQIKVLARYFQFQVVNVLLVTTVAGSLFDVLGRIMNHPSDTFTLLGETLPKIAGYFCDYVTIRGFSTLSLELIRAPYIMVSWLRSCTPLGRYKRDADRVRCGLRTYDNPGSFNYGKTFAQDLMALTMVMTYACMAPVIVVPGLIFFYWAQVIYRHQLLYVYVPEFESGGEFFPVVFRRFIFAMFTAQATMIGMFLLKNGLHQAYATTALMAFTFIYKVKMRALYEPIAVTLPLEIATALDMDRQGQVDQGNLEQIEYLQKELKEPAILEPEIEIEKMNRMMDPENVLLTFHPFD
eukprot:CAMPEP_0171454212 /NCGR_PEP_ID=MMETSP0945-20130129/1592_1 /TAXON_ID=109269 /ORGANISM="Vaucheria litorea, Strain CCMP2940" /LENGTH=539 /DNA_ID=CAMNT_0011979197 /DNA_START=1259 /DNA_END=2878 /DNA_ORIENTATION=-